MKPKKALGLMALMLLVFSAAAMAQSLVGATVDATLESSVVVEPILSNTVSGRTISEERLEIIKTALAEKKAAIAAKIVAFSESHDAYKEALSEYRDSLTDEAFTHLMVRAKAHLNNIVDTAVAFLEEARVRVEDNPHIPAEVEAEFMAKISFQIDELLELKPKIDAAGNREEMREVIMAVNAELSDTRQLFKMIHIRVYWHNLNSMVDKAYSIEATMQAKIDEIKLVASSVTDVSGLEAIKDRFVAEALAAKGYLEQARILYNQSDARPAEIKEMLSLARESLYNADLELHAFIELYNELTINVPELEPIEVPETETEAEVEVETEATANG